MMVLEERGSGKSYLNPKKYKFNKPEVEFLRYIIGIEGIKINPKKIKAI